MAVDSGSEAVGDSVDPCQTVDGTQSRDDGVADETTTHGGVCYSDEDFGLDFSGPDDGEDVDSPGGRGHGVDSSDDGGYDLPGEDMSIGVDPAYGDYDWFDGDGVDDDDRVYSNPGAYEEDLRSAPVGPGDDGGLVLDWDPRAFDDW